MFGRGGWCLLVAAFVISLPSLIAGQTDRSVRRATQFLSETPSAQIDGGRTIYPFRRPLPPNRVLGFPQFVRAAGLIFSGTVTGIERRPARLGQSVETVAVTFHIENAFRGATPGEDITITQWIGLWSSGQRYRLGERALLFLYPKSGLGLTSWVGGTLGHFAIDPWGRVMLTAQHLAAFQKDPVLGGKSHARISDFALAVRHAGEEE